MLAQIDRAEAAAPVPLPSDPLPFEKVAVTGTLEPRFLAHFGTDVRMIPTGQTMGSSLLVPLVREQGPPVLVDLGWLPDQTSFTPPPGQVRLVGYVRPPEGRSWFMPGDDLVHRRFWSLDPARIGAALGAGALAPFTIVALEPVAPGLQPAAGLPRPPNDHLNYAITWFSLALVGLVIFIIHVRRSARP